MFARNALSLILAAGLTISGSAALAGTVEGGTTVPVRFGDLDLKTEAGVTALKQRIARAARKACRVDNIRDLKQMSAADACRESALSTALREVELAVAAAHKGESYASTAGAINVRSR